MNPQIVISSLITLLIVMGFVASDNPQSPQEITYQDPKYSSRNYGNSKHSITGYLQRYADYCNDEAKKKENHWFHYTACEKSSEVVIAGFTIVLAFATICLIVVGLTHRSELKRITERMEDTARKELRAYIGIPSGSLYPLSATVLRAHIDIANVGQTPAQHVTPSITGEVRDPGDNRPFPDPAFIPHRQPLAPNQVWTVGHEFTDLTPETIADIRASRKLVYIWGAIKYFDIYDKEHVLRFRYRNVVREVNLVTGEIQRWFYYPEEHGNETT